MTETLPTTGRGLAPCPDPTLPAAVPSPRARSRPEVHSALERPGAASKGPGLGREDHCCYGNPRGLTICRVRHWKGGCEEGGGGGEGTRETGVSGSRSKRQKRTQKPLPVVSLPGAQSRPMSAPAPRCQKGKLRLTENCPGRAPPMTEGPHFREGFCPPSRPRVSPKFFH